MTQNNGYDYKKNVINLYMCKIPIPQIFRTASVMRSYFDHIYKSLKKIPSMMKSKISQHEEEFKQKMKLILKIWVLWLLNEQINKVTPITVHGTASEVWRRR